MSDDFYYQPSSKQQKQLQLLLDILSACQKSNVEVWVTGGYALDALYNKLTRDHNDFDIFVKGDNEAVFEKIIEKLGFVATPEKVGHVGKKIYINHSFAPPLRIEYGTIERGIELYEKLYGKVDPRKIKNLLPDVPLGKLNGQKVSVPTLEGLKMLIEINSELAKKNGFEEYPYKGWLVKILKILDH